MSDDEKISQRYRELGAEEPPRALDEAILAAATRSARSLHGSARPWSRRWVVPLSLAAVIVLSVTVTLRIQHERPGIEAPAPPAKESVPASPAPQVKEPAPTAAAPVADAQPKPKVEGQLNAAAGAPARERPAKPASQDEPKPFAPPLRDQAPAASPAAAVAPAPAAAVSSRADVARGAESSVAGAVAQQAGPVQALAKRAEAQVNLQAETPERELERIAELRRQGKHDEADKALADFRKRYPDFRIPEAMRERVERR